MLLSEHGTMARGKAGLPRSHARCHGAGVSCKGNGAAKLPVSQEQLLEPAEDLTQLRPRSWCHHREGLTASGTDTGTRVRAASWG